MQQNIAAYCSYLFYCVFLNKNIPETLKNDLMTEVVDVGFKGQCAHCLSTMCIE